MQHLQLLLAALVFSALASIRAQLQGNSPPPCITNKSELVYINGALSAGDTFVRCLENVPDPKLIPILFNGSYLGPLQVQTALQMNQIQDIDAVAGTSNMDFYVEFRWKDDRFAMPVFWDAVDPVFRDNGIRLQKVLYNSSGLFFWRPDIFFHDSLSISLLGEAIFFNADNEFYWQQHLSAKLAESLYDFTNFPYDTQDIVVRYGSFGYNASFLNISLVPNEPLSYVPNYDGRRNLFFNSEWAFKEEEAVSGIYTTNGEYTDAYFLIPMSRYTNGLVVRIIIPVAILLVLASLTFWASSPETRIAATTTILIAISALYIVTVGYIPLVGYASLADKFVLVMIGLLALVIALHVFYMLMHKHIYDEKEDERSLVPYSLPLKYFMTLLQSQVWWRVVIRVFHSRDADGGGAAAGVDGKLEIESSPPIPLSPPVTQGLRAQPVTGSRTIVPKFTTTKLKSGRTKKQFERLVPKRPDQSPRDMEHMKPRLTLVMLGLQGICRVFFLPFTLIYTGRLMLQDFPETLLAIQIVAPPIGFCLLLWESWHLACKYWELSCVHDERWKEREALLRAYAELKDRLITLPNDQFLAAAFPELLPEYEHLIHEHAQLIAEHRQWLLHVAEIRRLPPPDQQLSLLGQHGDLLLVHDTIRDILLQRCAAAATVAGGASSSSSSWLSRRQDRAKVNGGADMDDRVPRGAGRVVSSISTSTSTNTKGVSSSSDGPDVPATQPPPLPQSSACNLVKAIPSEEALKSEFAELVKLQYVLLSKYPGLQAELREFYECSGPSGPSLVSTSAAPAVEQDRSSRFKQPFEVQLPDKDQEHKNQF